jgi:predicted metalloprotease
MRRVLVLLLATLVLAGCGSGDAEQVGADARAKLEEVRQKAKDLREEADQLRKRLADRVRETLDRVTQQIPAAGPATRPPERRNATLDQFLTAVLDDVDAYWTTTLTAADLPAPRVGHMWLGAGERVRTGCGNIAGADAAFYCPADDTIYVSEVFAARIARGGGGDFGLAYVVAHEFAHDVQQELGWFAQGRQVAVKPFELQADCMAGNWANSVYRAGRIEPGDVEEAQRTAFAVGDFDRSNPQHHGTPVERRDAWLLGYRTGHPSACRVYVPT